MGNELITYETLKTEICSILVGTMLYDGTCTGEN